MAKTQRAHHQPRHDLVAHPQIKSGVEHVVRQRHGGGHRDHLTTGNAQLHARLTLRNAIAHGRHATGELPHRAQVAQGLLDLFGKGFVGLMGRQHVVVGRHDGHVGRIHQAQGLLVVTAAASYAMGEVGALQLAPLRAFAGGGTDHLQVALARGAAALDKTFGNFNNAGMHGKSPG